MTIQQMEYIVAVNRYRHFVKASEECGVTQPTLSTMIQKLEDELNVKIFDRNKHPIEPTKTGERIFRQAEVALHEIHRIEEMVHNETKTLSGNIRIGIIPTIAPYLVPQFISIFKKDYPDVALSISEMKTDNIIYNLKNSLLDMAIVSTPIDQNGLLEIPIYYEKFVAYFSPDEPRKNTGLSATDMPMEHLWVLQEGHCFRKQIFNFCGKSSTHNTTYEAGSIETLIRIVDSNGGYTVIPELHLPLLSETQKANIKDITSPPAIREISIIIRNDYIKERIINAVADTIKKIIPEHMLDEHLKKFSIKL